MERADIGHELGIPVHKWHDSERPPEAIIVALHGLVFDSRAFHPLAKHLSTRGYTVFAADMRGFGEWRRCDNDCAGDQLFHFTLSKDDLTRLLQGLRSKYPGLPIYCIGESFGANIALWEASTNPDLMDGAVLCGLSYKVAVHPKLIWVKTFFESLASPKKPLNLVPYVGPIMSENKATAEACLQSPYTCTNMSMTDLIKAGITNRRAVKLIKQIPESMPILIIAGEKDMIQKTRTISDMVSKMGSKKTEFVVLPEKGHLLLEREVVDAEAEQLIEKWLEKQVMSRKAAADAADANVSLLPLKTPPSE